VANAVAFTLITPLSVKFDGEAELVIAVGTEGEEGILPSHAPFLTALKPGVLRANVRDGTEGTKRLELATSEGFLQALPGKVTVLVDSALAAGEVDIAATRADLAASAERIKTLASDSPAYKREQVAIDFANAKLKVAGV
jgi:F-type H+-transporting ATPase subunit epsilon